MTELTQQRKEFETWLGTETCEVHWDESAEKNAWYGWQAGRSSLESDRKQFAQEIVDWLEEDDGGCVNPGTTVLTCTQLSALIRAKYGIGAIREGTNV